MLYINLCYTISKIHIYSLPVYRLSLFYCKVIRYIVARITEIVLRISIRLCRCSDKMAYSDKIGSDKMTDKIEYLWNEVCKIGLDKIGLDKIAYSDKIGGISYKASNKISQNVYMLGQKGMFKNKGLNLTLIESNINK